MRVCRGKRVPRHSRRGPTGPRLRPMHLVFTAILSLFLSTLWTATSLGASAPALESEQGMVVSSQRLASEAGIEILKAGGYAVDAAVAVGYAQAVVNPCC